MDIEVLKFKVGRYILDDFYDNSAKSWTIGNSYPGYDNVIHFHHHKQFQNAKFRLGDEIGTIYEILEKCCYRSDIILFAMENNIISEEEETA